MPWLLVAKARIPIVRRYDEVTGLEKVTLNADWRSKKGCKRVSPHGCPI